MAREITLFTSLNIFILTCIPFMPQFSALKTLNVFALRFESVHSRTESASFHLCFFNATQRIMPCLSAVLAVHSFVKLVKVSHLDIIWLLFLLNQLLGVLVLLFL